LRIASSQPCSTIDLNAGAASSGCLNASLSHDRRRIDIDFGVGDFVVAPHNTGSRFEGMRGVPRQPPETIRAGSPNCGPVCGLPFVQHRMLVTMMP